MREEALLALFAQRDEAAIELLRQEYGAYCGKIAAAILPCAEDCEECLNDVWNLAWQSLPTQRPQRLKAYLGAITRNAAKNRYDRLTAEKRGGSESALVLEELSECVAGPESPEDAVLAGELAAEINRFLRRLSARERDVFLRRYYFADSTAAIAARYRLREDHVLVILSRTRQKLKKHLKQEGYLE